jgi:hypothetical protein
MYRMLNLAKVYLISTVPKFWSLALSLTEKCLDRQHVAGVFGLEVRRGLGMNV